MSTTVTPAPSRFSTDPSDAPHFGEYVVLGAAPMATMQRQPLFRAPLPAAGAARVAIDLTS